MSAVAMRALSRREARALLARAAEVQAEAEAIVEIVSSARAEVVEAYAVASEPQVWTAIGKMSIETVKDTVDGRARLDELPAHGIYSVADVLRAGPDRLMGVPGIGEGTARKTIHAAEQLKRAARDSLQFRIEFDPKNPDMTRLLRALATWGGVWHAAGVHEADAERVAAQLAHREHDHLGWEPAAANTESGCDTTGRRDDDFTDPSCRRPVEVTISQRNSAPSTPTAPTDHDTAPATV